MRPIGLFLMVALAIAAPLSASVDVPREGERWTRIDLDDYVIFSAARDSVTRDVANRLQMMGDGLAMMTRLNVHPPARVTVIVFPTERAFAPFRDASMGKKMTRVSALHASTADAEYILIDADAEGGIDRSIFHELVHSFTRNSSEGDLPLWFMEGLAEFYSTFQPYGNDQLRVGMPIAEHLQWLQQRGLMPLARLFAVDTKSADYSEEYHAGDFYAQSWLLVHYLMIGNAARRAQLGTFLTLLGEKKPVDAAFEQAFGAKYVQLENELHHYLAQPTMNILTYTMPSKKSYAAVDPKPASRDAVLTMLGGFLLRSEKLDDAKAFFDAALMTNPKNGDTCAALGVLAERNGKPDDADKWFEKAATYGTGDASAYVAYGRSLLEKIDAMHRHATAAQIEKPRAMFEKAAALNPRSAAAFAGVGATYLLSEGDEEKGIAAYLKSLAIERREDVAVNLVTLYARIGRRDLAEKTIQRYLSSGSNPDAAAMARETLLVADLNRAIELARTGKRDESKVLAERVRDSAQREDVKRRAAQLVDTLAAAGIFDSEVAEFNRAVTLANSGRTKEALAIVDGLLPRIANPELLERARDLRRELIRR
jgi:tetratricopeptide (TPR) repeat protein